MCASIFARFALRRPSSSRCRPSNKSCIYHDATTAVVPRYASSRQCPRRRHLERGMDGGGQHSVWERGRARESMVSGLFLSCPLSHSICCVFLSVCLALSLGLSLVLSLSVCLALSLRLSPPASLCVCVCVCLCLSVAVAVCSCLWLWLWLWLSVAVAVTVSVRVCASVASLPPPPPLPRPPCRCRLALACAVLVVTCCCCASCVSCCHDLPHVTMVCFM